MLCWNIYEKLRYIIYIIVDADWIRTGVGRGGEVRSEILVVSYIRLD